MFEWQCGVVCAAAGGWSTQFSDLGCTISHYVLSSHVRVSLSALDAEVFGNTLWHLICHTSKGFQQAQLLGVSSGTHPGF